MVLAMNPGAQSGHSLEAHIEVQHRYKYDDHGNWIEQTSLSSLREQVEHFFHSTSALLLLNTGQGNAAGHFECLTGQ
jgi:hypothetical protein